MKRPFSSRRPLGPFAQLGSGHCKLAFQYSSGTVDANLPPSHSISTNLDRVWSDEDAVARVEDVTKIVPRGKGVSAIKIAIQPSTLTQDQLNNALDIGEETLEDMGVEIFQSAVTLDHP